MPDPTTPHVKTIESIYAAFGRGDLPAILAQVADEVDWGPNLDFRTPGASRVPYGGVCRNRDEIARRYFAPIAEAFEFRNFVPRVFMAGGAHVSVLLEVDLVVRRTGRRIAFEEMHCFAFDDAGRIVRYRAFQDTAQMIDACTNSSEGPHDRDS